MSQSHTESELANPWAVHGWRYVAVRPVDLQEREGRRPTDLNKTTDATTNIESFANGNAKVGHVRGIKAGVSSARGDHAQPYRVL